MLVTFKMVAVIEFQHTFTPDEVERENGGGGSDLTPTATAMQALTLELENAVRPLFCPRRVELEADVELGRENGE